VLTVLLIHPIHTHGLKREVRTRLNVVDVKELPTDGNNTLCKVTHGKACILGQ
jgi:hypothetical protein